MTNRRRCAAPQKDAYLFHADVFEELREREPEPAARRLVRKIRQGAERQGSARHLNGVTPC